LKRESFVFTDTFPRGTPLQGWMKEDHGYSSNWHKSKVGLLIQDGREPENAGGWSAFLAAGSDGARDICVEADIRQLGDAGGSSVGVIVGHGDGENYLRYEERKDYQDGGNRFRRLVRVRGGEEELLRSDAYQTDYIPTDIYYRITERIRMEHLGGRLRVWHDHILLWDLDLEGEICGGVGLYCAGAGIMACQSFDVREIEEIDEVHFQKLPYLQNPAGNSVTVMWETSEVSGSDVEYGIDGSLDSVERGEPGAIHNVRLTDLAPGRRYSYRVKSGGHSSPIADFTTPDERTSLRFCVYGDTHCTDVASRVAEAIEGESPDFVICVGDAVGNGRLYSHWNRYFKSMAGLFSKVPSYHAVGNHDGTAGDAALAAWFYRYMSHPGYTDHYAFTRGDCRFVVLDNYELIGPGSQQYEWLVGELEGEDFQDARFRLAFFHEPPYCVGWGIQSYDGNPEARAVLLPLLRENGVDVIFCGHCHDYERADLDGVHLVITGGGGGTLDERCYDVDRFRAYADIFHYVVVDIDGDELSSRAVSLDGKTFDRFKITR